MALPLGTTGSLSPTFVSARFVNLAVKLPYTHTLFSPIADRAEETVAILRYSLGGYRPSKTDLLALFSARITARS